MLEVVVPQSSAEVVVVVGVTLLFSGCLGVRLTEAVAATRAEKSDQLEFQNKKLSNLLSSFNIVNVLIVLHH